MLVAISHTDKGKENLSASTLSAVAAGTTIQKLAHFTGTLPIFLAHCNVAYLPYGTPPIPNYFLAQLLARSLYLLAHHLPQRPWVLEPQACTGQRRRKHTQRIQQQVEL